MKEKAPTLRQFQDRFPSEESCLEHLMRVRFGQHHYCAGCKRRAHYYRVKARRSYACEYCAHQVYPTAGTPFDRTRTPLRDWFFVMFQFCASRNGVAAKEVERQLGVTYKTAWRMCHQIREYMGQVDGGGPIGGMMVTVEIDEAYLGGKTPNGQGGAGKKIVLVMMEKHGRVVTRVVPSKASGALMPVIVQTVRPLSQIHTDKHLGYGGLSTINRYSHATVDHGLKQYVSPTGVTTNRIEGFWSMLQRAINGTHIHVSSKHLPKYLREFEYRWNMRDQPHLMVDRLMYSFAR